MSPKNRENVAMAELYIPRALCGRGSDVDAAWRTVTKAAVSQLSFAGLFTPPEMVNVEDAEGELLNIGPVNGHGSADIHLYAVRYWLFELTQLADRDKWYTRSRSLVLNSMSEAWFRLCIVCGQRWFPSRSPYEDDRRHLDRLLLGYLLNDWERFASLTPRFHFSDLRRIDEPDAWRQWAIPILKMATDLGCPDVSTRAIEGVSSEVAIDRLRRWYEGCNRMS